MIIFPRKQPHKGNFSGICHNTLFVVLIIKSLARAVGGIFYRIFIAGLEIFPFATKISGEVANLRLVVTLRLYVMFKKRAAVFIGF